MKKITTEKLLEGLDRYVATRKKYNDMLRGRHIKILVQKEFNKPKKKE